MYKQIHMVETSSSRRLGEQRRTDLSCPIDQVKRSGVKTSPHMLWKLGFVNLRSVGLFSSGNLKRLIGHIPCFEYCYLRPCE
jgi:hypothetical protein